MPLLHVSVLEGRDLLSKDYHFISPFCIIQIVDNSQKIKQSKRTHVLRNPVTTKDVYNISPIWSDGSFTFEVSEFSALRISCWDRKTKFTRTLLGQIDFTSQSVCAEPIEGWYNLTTKTGDEIKAFLRVKIYYQAKSSEEYKQTKKKKKLKKKQLEKTGFSLILKTNEQMLKICKCKLFYDDKPYKGTLTITDQRICFHSTKKRLSGDEFINSHHDPNSLIKSYDDIKNVVIADGILEIIDSNSNKYELAHCEDAFGVMLSHWKPNVKQINSHAGPVSESCIAKRTVKKSSKRELKKGTKNTKSSTHVEPQITNHKDKEQIVNLQAIQETSKNLEILHAVVPVKETSGLVEEKITKIVPSWHYDLLPQKPTIMNKLEKFNHKYLYILFILSWLVLLWEVVIGGW